VLTAFRSGRPLLGVSELGREVGLSRSTTHRYVSTLATLGYLEQDGATKKYRRCRSSRRGQRAIDLNLHVGSRLPAYCTSMGKILLAYLPREQRDAVLAQLDLRQRGPNS
jgi:IclR family pca regulon transcriptional regulator